VPETEVIFYQERPGKAPVVRWLKQLKTKDRRGFAKCAALIERLAQDGYELRRPAADYLDDGIYELRARAGNAQYRLLYFFHGQGIAVLSHALSKESVISAADLKRAVERKARFQSNPEAHTYEEANDDDEEEDEAEDA
jgi:phage-related protein